VAAAAPRQQTSQNHPGSTNSAVELPAPRTAPQDWHRLEQREQLRAGGTSPCTDRSALGCPAQFTVDSNDMSREHFVTCMVSKKIVKEAIKSFP